MNKLLLFPIIIMLITLPCFAQSVKSQAKVIRVVRPSLQIDEQDTIVLWDAFRQLTSEATVQRRIIYVDTVKYQRMPLGLKRNLEKGIIKDGKDSKDSLILTKEEQKYLFEQTMQRAIWPDNLFANSKKIDSRSEDIYLEEVNEKRYADAEQVLLNGDTATYRKLKDEFNSRENTPYVFEFIKPIYLRDKTICLVSLGAMIGGAGTFASIFYKKENNEWKSWIWASLGYLN